jgi:flagellar hook-associated protein 3 FlgL
MLNSQLLRDINNNLQRMAKNQERLASQSMVNRPSDDPVASTLILRYREELAANFQYQRNVDDAMSWLEQYDSALKEVNDILQAAREEAIRAANGTNPDTSLEAIAQKIGQLYEQLVAVGNTQFKGKYIFNGKNVKVPPDGNFSMQDPNNDKIEFEVMPNVLIQVNVLGKAVFGDSSDNAFKILQDLIVELNTPTGNIDSIIGRLDARIDEVLNQWTDVGARMNRLELIKSRLQDEDYNLQKLLSKAQDTDVAKIYMLLKTDENVYQASLSVGARIIRPSLVDFLR